MPEGPMDIVARRMIVPVRNLSDEPTTLSRGVFIGTAKHMNPEQELIAMALEQVDHEEFFVTSENTRNLDPPYPSHCTEPVEPICALNKLEETECSRHVSTRTVALPGLSCALRWALLVLLVLSRVLPVSHPEPITCVRAMGPNLEEDLMPGRENESVATEANHLWTDLASAANKSALAGKLDEMRNERYGHLSDSRFMKLKTTLLQWPRTLAIDGVLPGVVDGYDFDIELHKNATPHRAQLPKLSPKETEKERFHIEKETQLGHLRVPTDEQKSEWSTRTYVVFKKDDPNGRWICDFRPLNRATIKRVSPMGDVFAKVRSFASRLWKSGLDALSGFNQMRATERAKRLMQIITTMGVRQWEVLPFGVCNGPPYFQEFMPDLYGGGSSGKSNMLGDSMVDVNASLEVWVDDVQLGTGNASNSPDEPLDGEADRELDDHLIALSRVLERAATAKLKFNLKVFFRAT